VDTAGLAAWAGKLAHAPLPLARWAALALVTLTWSLVIAWSFGLVHFAWFMLALLAQGGFALWVAPRVRHALEGLHGRSLDLFHLTHLLTNMEQAPFTAPRLVELQAALRADGEPPSRRLQELSHLIDRLDSTKNQLFGIIAPFLLWTTQTAFQVERWRWQTAAALPRWVEAVGEIEALTSLAGYAFENPDDPFPEVVAEGPLFEGAGLGHPLLPRKTCVTNDVSLSGAQRLLLVSGSNMSGKSTFLRTVGVNAVLALAGAPVRAERLRLSPLAIGATLRIQDSLQAGRSRFYAEITRLRQVIDLTQGPLPLLYLFDEILHGTNSHDRRIGTEGILHTLLERPAIGLVTTHDLALTQIAANLEPLARNVHFEDQLEGGTLHFDYRLRPGVVTHSNALALMRAVGIQVSAEDGAK
jgi:DNA mismatch repair ATPase MutS